MKANKLPFRLKNQLLNGKSYSRQWWICSQHYSVISL